MKNILISILLIYFSISVYIENFNITNWNTVSFIVFILFIMVAILAIIKLKQLKCTFYDNCHKEASYPEYLDTISNTNLSISEKDPFTTVLSKTRE